MPIFLFLHIRQSQSPNSTSHIQSCKKFLPPPSNLQKKRISDILIEEATFKEQKEKKEKKQKPTKPRKQVNEMKTILIIDDDIDIGNMLQEALAKEGYDIRRAYSGTEALYVLKSGNTPPDLILLDLMLPGLDGEKLLPQIKQIPVIVVSAKVDLENKVDLLRSGAVDYITKPFHMKELLARVSVHLRNTPCRSDGSALTFENITLLTDRHVAAVDGAEVKLTRTEYAILKLLMQNPLQVVAKSLILDRISEDTPDCTESSLKMHVSNLRKKLREPSGKDYIEAVWGIGFKMRND